MFEHNARQCDGHQVVLELKTGPLNPNERGNTERPAGIKISGSMVSKIFQLCMGHVPLNVCIDSRERSASNARNVDTTKRPLDAPLGQPGVRC
jgi:hypothetical protein